MAAQEQGLEKALLLAVMNAEAAGQREWQEVLQAQEDERQRVQGLVDRAQTALEAALAAVAEARARETERTEISRGSGSSSSSSSSSSNNNSNNSDSKNKDSNDNNGKEMEKKKEEDGRRHPWQEQEQWRHATDDKRMEEMDRKHAQGMKHTLPSSHNTSSYLRITYPLVLS